MSEPQGYPFAEIKKHNKQDDTWVTYKGKVVDASKFAYEHPGGKDLILEYAGQDITDIFEDTGHSVDAEEHLETLVIGKLTDEANAKEDGCIIS